MEDYRDTLSGTYRRYTRSRMAVHVGVCGKNNNDVIFVRLKILISNNENYVRTLSNPAVSNRLPSVSPTPAKSVTGFSPIGSATKLRCF